MAASPRTPLDGSRASDRGGSVGGSRDALEGSLLGRFRIGSSLDRSGARRVYAAIDTSTGAAVAIKLGRPRRTPAGRRDGDEAVLARLRHEAEVLRQLDCAGVPCVKAFNEQPPYLVLERIDGIDLEHTLATRAQALASSDIAALCAGLAEILTAVHGRGFLHADIKPSNILLRDGGLPVLVDFGSARRLVAPDDGEGDDWSVTPGYAPPEFHRADIAIGPWSDIYALGAVAYRIIAGRPPVPAEARLRGATMPSAVEAAGASCPAELAAVIDWALELDPAARPFSAEEWRHVVCRIAKPGSEDTATVPIRRRVRGGLGAVRQSADNAVRTPRRPVRVWRAVAGFAAVAAAAALLGGRDLYALYESRVKQEWIVDANGQGDETTIAAALARAREGATVRIRPGIYHESLAIARPVELLGIAEDGQQPIVTATNGSCITVTAAASRISHLLLRGASGAEGEGAACVEVAAGQTAIEGVRISGASGAGVLVRNGAELRLVNSSVSDSGGAGVLVTGTARALVSGGEIRGSGRSGIIVRGGAELHIIGTHVGGTREAGLLLAEGAAARIENATISESGTSAVEIRSGARGTIADSVIARAGQAGIFVLDAGTAMVERTQVANSGLSGLIVAAAGEASVDGGAFEDNREHGVLVLEFASGIVANSRIVGNRGHGIAIQRGAAGEMTDNVVERNGEPQIFDTRRSDGGPSDRRRGGAS
jgi:hypothetical protein